MGFVGWLFVCVLLLIGVYIWSTRYGQYLLSPYLGPQALVSSIILFVSLVTSHTSPLDTRAQSLFTVDSIKAYKPKLLLTKNTESPYDNQPVRHEDPPIAVFHIPPPTNSPKPQSQALVPFTISIHAIFLVFIAVVFVGALIERKARHDEGDEDDEEQARDEGPMRYRYESFPPMSMNKIPWWRKVNM